MNQNKPNTNSDAQEKSCMLRGNIILFHAFDVGKAIDMQNVKDNKMVSISSTMTFPYFKNYHTPLFVRPPSLQASQSSDEAPQNGSTRTDCLYARLHSFGVISLGYKIPFCATLDSLKFKVIQSVDDYRKISLDDAESLFEKILPAIHKPNFYNLTSEYYAVQVNTINEALDGEEFKQRFGSHIASILRLETETLSEFQEEDILDSVTGYYGKDVTIIDTEGAFIFDDEYFEMLEFFELANVQKLELQCFDRLLDSELDGLHQNQKYKISVMSYLPVFGTSLDTLLDKLVQLRLDVSVVSERLSNGITMVGDAYYNKLYHILIAKLGLNEWKNSITEKMTIINELYQVRKSRIDTAKDELLTIVIIILIALEAAVAIFK